MDIRISEIAAEKRVPETHVGRGSAPNVKRRRYCMCQHNRIRFMMRTREKQPALPEIRTFPSFLGSLN